LMAGAKRQTAICYVLIWYSLGLHQQLFFLFLDYLGNYTELPSS